MKRVVKSACSNTLQSSSCKNNNLIANQTRSFSKTQTTQKRTKAPFSRVEKGEYDISNLVKRLDIVKQRLNRPLTLSEKILYGHLDDPANQEIVRGKSYLKLRPDRVVSTLGKITYLEFLNTDCNDVATPHINTTTRRSCSTFIFILCLGYYTAIMAIIIRLFYNDLQSQCRF